MGIKVVVVVGFMDIKIDIMVMCGVNYDELVDLIEFVWIVNVEVRFIEYMDVGGVIYWVWEKVFIKVNMFEFFEKWYGCIEFLFKYDMVFVN